MPLRKKKRENEDEGEEKEKKKRARASQLFTITLHALLVFGNIKYRVLNAFNQYEKLLPLSEYVIALETGFKHRKTMREAMQDVANGHRYQKSPFHCHVYIKTVEPIMLADLRCILIDEMLLPVSDLEVCKSSRSYLKYITKEDWQPVIKNVDVDLMHVQFKMKSIVMHNPYLKYTDNKVSSIPFCYQKQMRALHAEYWSEINSTLDKVSSSPHKNVALVNILKRGTHRGYILYGETGKGKTSSVQNIISSPYYLFSTRSNFPMTNYNGERDILIDDTDVMGVLKHRETLLQLTGPYSAPCEVKGGDVMKINFQGTVYITMNDDPNVLQPEWKRRFKIVHAL